MPNSSQLDEKDGFEHFLYVVDPSNEKANEKAVESFHQLIFDFEDRENIEVEYSSYILADIVRSFSRDVTKLISVDRINLPSEYRIAGLITFWIRKLKPLFKITNFKQEINAEDSYAMELFLNEQFAIDCGLAQIDLDKLFGNHDTIRDDIYRVDGPHLLSNLRYRAISPQAMASHFEQAIELRLSQEGTIDSLLHALEYRDDETGQHVHRVRAISMLLARECGLPGTDIWNLHLVSPMHDIGKIGTPDKILKKTGRLTEDEFLSMQQHTILGWDLLMARTNGYRKPSFIDMAQDVALYHHEKYDGNGYPSQLKGEKIPRAARIVSIADAYDAMRQKRCYKTAMSAQEAYDEIMKGKNKQFDPELCKIFAEKRDIIEALYIESEDHSAAPLN